MSVSWLCRSWRCTIPVTATCLTMFAACVADSPDTALEEPRLGAASSPLWGKELWRYNRIPVCYESGVQLSPQHQYWVKEALAKTWEKHAGLSFWGFGPCQGDQGGIHIKVYDNPNAQWGDEDWPHASVGRTISGEKDGMVLNPNVACPATPAAEHRDCFQFVVAHEFGHALGFPHEHDRPDRVDLVPCGAKADPDVEGTYLTDYDPDSIMHYCVNRRTPVLSALDIQGAVRAYGPPNTFMHRRLVTRNGGYYEGSHSITADFDRNGTTDVAYMFPDGNRMSVHVFTGSRDGFSREIWSTRQVGVPTTRYVVAGNFDGVGGPDLAMMFDDNRLMSIDVHRNDGSQFTAQRWNTRDNGGVPGSMQLLVADFDHQPGDDIVKVFEDNNRISIDLHRNTGSSFVISRASTQNGGWPSSGRGWVAGDFDSDGWTDVAMLFVENGYYALDVHRNNHARGFEPPKRQALGMVAFESVAQFALGSAQAGDFDGDGRVDVAVVAPTAYDNLMNIESFSNVGFGIFTHKRLTTRQTVWPSVVVSGIRWPRADFARHWLSGDFDGDRTQELMVMFGDQGSVSIDRYGRLPSAHKFGAYETAWNAGFYGTRATLLGDVDGDRRADLVGASDGFVGVIRSTGSGFGGYEQWWRNSFFGAHGTLLGDVDGDGKSDLVGLGEGYIAVIRSTGTAFGAYEKWANQTFSGKHGTLLGDVDGDGDADLVALNDANITVRRSNGTGNGIASAFDAPETWWSSGFYGSHGTLLGDVNGDGKADLVGLGDGYVGVVTSLGSSFGTYQTWRNSNFYGRYGTFLADVNGDRRADLVGLGDGYIGVAPSSNGFFGYETWWNASFYGAYGSFLGDVDGDGQADLVGAADGYVGLIRATPQAIY